MGLFDSPRFIQAGIKVEPSTYTTKSAPLMDQRKLWSGQRSFNNSINQQVSMQPLYSNHGPPQTTNEQDGIYTGASTDGMIPRNSGEHLMLNLTKDKQSYLGTFNIVLNSGQSSR